MSTEKFGFVYIWYDRKRSMYYIGSHWGTETDGYICSSNHMRKAYRRRPHDFKRRIITRVYTNRLDLLNEEQKWFDQVKHKNRYYNLRFSVMKPAWAQPDYKMTVGQKISQTRKGMKLSEQHCKNIAAAKTGVVHSEATKAKMSATMKAKPGKPIPEETKAKIRKDHHFTSPEGEPITISNLPEFCATNNLHYVAMTKLSKGTYGRDRYKGWSKQ